MEKTIYNSNSNEDFSVLSNAQYPLGYIRISVKGGLRKNETRIN